MGSGSWSKDAYKSYSISNALDSSSIDEVFENSHIDACNSMRSFNVDARQYNKVNNYQMSAGVRECRDSEEHPNTTPIIVAFDVTGSMGDIPYEMVTKYLPKLMNRLKEIGVPDPELMFMGIGDYHCDDAPIQVTQFESDTEKICEALRSLYLEGGGGGDRCESYLMAWIAAGYHTETDSWFKRHKKGFLFTIGDEGNHKDVPSHALVRFMSYEKGCPAITATEALKKAKEQYEVYHIHVNDGYNSFSNTWRETMGDHVLRCDSNQINKVIADTIHASLGDSTTITPGAETAKVEETVEKDQEYKY
jgi:hypothetical protein